MIEWQTVRLLQNSRLNSLLDIFVKAAPFADVFAIAYVYTKMII